jgi:hypothetical protein
VSEVFPRRRYARFVGLIVGAAIVMAPWWVGNDAAQAQVQTQDPRAGIERAKAEGMVIDPLVEPLMAEAPLGSCINDPTQAQCPAARAVVYAPEFFNIPKAERLPRPRFDHALSARAIKAAKRAATLRGRIKARSAQNPGFGCHMKVNEGSPYKAAGYEQMDAQHYCTVTIQDLDIYLRLRKYYSGQWYNMTNRWFYPTNVNRHWYGSLRYDCTSLSVYRQWQAEMHAYTMYNNVWYAGYHQRQASDYCG